MTQEKRQKIWTVGHSTHDWEEFVGLLKTNGIERLVDVRSLPGSNKFPQFNQDPMERALPEAQIEYCHMPDLGGRRKKVPLSTSSAWRVQSFRNYADYTHTDEFQAALARLEELGAKELTCMMCAEAVWWRCHRSLIADYLKFRGWQVLHIMSMSQIQEHPYTAPAREQDGELVYGEKGAVLREG